MIYLQLECDMGWYWYTSHSLIENDVIFYLHQPHEQTFSLDTIIMQQPDIGSMLDLRRSLSDLSSWRQNWRQAPPPPPLTKKLSILTRIIPRQKLIDYFQKSFPEIFFSVPLAWLVKNELFESLKCTYRYTRSHLKPFIKKISGGVEAYAAGPP